jgi:hypothetical protein
MAVATKGLIGKGNTSPVTKKVNTGLMEPDGIDQLKTAAGKGSRSAITALKELKRPEVLMGIAMDARKADTGNRAIWALEELGCSINPELKSSIKDALDNISRYASLEEVKAEAKRIQKNLGFVEKD